MNDFNNNDSSQFVVSYELLQLFKWLFEHEQETLKKLIARSLRNGLGEHIHLGSQELGTNEELQQSVVDFFALLETLLYEIINEDEVRRIVQRNLIPALDHIDAALWDTTAVQVSVAKATSTLETNPEKNGKELLCKELLKRWKPAKKLANH